MEKLDVATAKFIAEQIEEILEAGLRKPDMEQKLSALVFRIYKQIVK